MKISVAYKDYAGVMGRAFKTDKNSYNATAKTIDIIVDDSLVSAIRVAAHTLEEIYQMNVSVNPQVTREFVEKNYNMCLDALKCYNISVDAAKAFEKYFTAQ